MVPLSVGIKTELDRLSSTQNFTKSVVHISTHPVVMSGGFLTKNSSLAFQKQQAIMSENKSIVYANALERYKILLEKGESNKKNYLEERVRQIEENKRLEIETRQKKREKILSHRVNLIKQASEKVRLILFNYA